MADCKEITLTENTKTFLHLIKHTSFYKYIRLDDTTMIKRIILSNVEDPYDDDYLGVLIDISLLDIDLSFLTTKALPLERLIPLRED